MSRSPSKKLFYTRSSFEKEIRAATESMGIGRMGEFNASDIFIASYPKSGNTWLRYLIASAFFGVDLEFAPASLLQDVLPDLHDKSYFRRFFPFAFFKTHFLPQPEYRRAIYLLRDGRDVMVSYYHYLNALSEEKLDFLDLVQTGKIFPCKWSEHTERWLENPYKTDVLLMRYEDLKKNPVAELQRICEFTGLKRDLSVLENAVKKASFEAMQKREQVFWEGSPWPKDRKFVRRGQVGSHKDEMPDEVREAFLRDASATLKKAGYIA